VIEVAIAIQFTERWRVGTGSSRTGAVDDETWATDVGEVCAPAKHLKGRLREQAEDLAPRVGMVLCAGRLAGQAEVQGPGSCDGERGACPGCRLFGSPRVDPSWTFGAAVVTLPPIPVDDRVLRRAQRVRTTHNRIDHWARRTAQDLLFTLEDAREGLEATATIAYQYPGQPPDDELALLVAAVGGLESLGARRRRGMGACTAFVLGAPGGSDHDQWVDRFIDGPWPGTRP